MIAARRPAIAPPLPDWARRAFIACSAWFDAAPPALSARLSFVRARTARGQGASSVEGALTAPFSTPFIALSEAYRRDLELPDDGAMSAIGEGTLALYFYLRIQDDIVDEPDAFDRADVYTCEVMAGASAEAFARAVGDRVAFWGFRRAVLDELAATSAWELDTYRRTSLEEAGAGAEEHAAMLGSKLVPIAVPLGAIAALAGKQEAFAWLGPCARSLGRSLQIANDLFNARDDHSAKRLTPSLAALYAGGRVTPEDQAFRVWPALASDGAMERMLRAARGHAAASIEVARRAGAPLLAEEIGMVTSVLDEVPARLLKLSLGVPP